MSEPLQAQKVLKQAESLQREWLPNVPGADRDAYDRVFRGIAKTTPISKGTTPYEQLYMKTSKYHEDFQAAKPPARFNMDCYRRIAVSTLIVVRCARSHCDVQNLYRDLVTEEGLHMIEKWSKEARDEEKADLLRVLRSIKGFKQANVKGSSYRDASESVAEAMRTIHMRPNSASLRAAATSSSVADAGKGERRASRPSSAPFDRQDSTKKLDTSLKAKMQKSSAPLAWGNPNETMGRSIRQAYGRTWDGSTFEPSSMMLSKAQMHRRLAELKLDPEDKSQGKQNSSYYRDFCHGQPPASIGDDVTQQFKDRIRQSQVPMAMSKKRQFYTNYGESNRQVDEAFKNGTLTVTPPLTLDLYTSAAVGAVVNAEVKNKNLAILERKLRKTMYRRRDDGYATISGPSSIPKLEFMPIGRNRY